MSITTSRRTKTIHLSKAEIEQIDTFLKSLPDKSKEWLLLHDAIDSLHECIKVALAKGYRYADLETELRKKGVTINPSTFKKAYKD